MSVKNDPSQLVRQFEFGTPAKVQGATEDRINNFYLEIFMDKIYYLQLKEIQREYIGIQSGK